jgi:hypothetical protein
VRKRWNIYSFIALLLNWFGKLYILPLISLHNGGFAIFAEFIDTLYITPRKCNVFYDLYQQILSLISYTNHNKF